ncbi:CDP-diacylglycerol--serine O-phosphatidyltransferase [Oricola cellulosilytica]|uniref:CDP-diacylglycerol--serine O-phosphatidyltransferase n=1 Tax=Oricola cellulosilytica TaxID=1429082 RepID=A0A4R0PFM1_9HYPH|nr:CDP-diacylglycerol--serine O-phosphatidyltransferase [Oricola cellulosilytica]TCD14284.1 CDP-diacylglycerol--serine O-phosphatidyltransferase [Oricola cellulosilytica]
MDIDEGPFASFEPDGPRNDDGAEGKRRLRDIQLRFVVPNIITVLAICAGMTGVRLAFEDRFDTAVAMVLLAAFLDGLDGRVARLVKGSSKFGAEMDSLADIVNFGVAPALVLYAFVLNAAGSLGWIAALLYAIACGLRLARFNVMMENRDRPQWQAAFFTGVPAPAGALLVLLPVYLGFLGIKPDLHYASVVSVYTLVIAFLMVSSLPVWSGKTLGAKIPRAVVIPVILGVVLYVALLATYTWQTMTFTAVAYIALLPISLRMWRKRAAQEMKKKQTAA